MSFHGSGSLRILVLLNRVPFPLNDGGAIGTFNFIKGYAEAGCKVTVLAMNTAKHYVDPVELPDVFYRYAVWSMVDIDNRIRVFGALRNLMTSESYVLSRFRSSEFAHKLTQILTENEFDVVHIDGLPPSLYIPEIRKLSKAKIAMRAHNVEHLIWTRIAAHEPGRIKSWYVNLQANRLKSSEQDAVKACDVVLAISREDQNSLLQLCPKSEIIVVPAAMDIADEKPKGNDAVNPLIFIGSFDWMPNVQGVNWFFRTIWPGLSARFPELRVHIAGKKMTDEVRSFQSEKVDAVGEVESATDFILNGGIMVVPVISGSGIRIKILEGMALGKCIIATSIAAEGLGLTDGQNILIADTPPQFEEKIGQCLNDSAFRKQIAANAHTFALENFQNKKVFERLTGFYRSLLT